MGRIAVFVAALGISVSAAAAPRAQEGQGDETRKTEGISNPELIRMLDTYAIVRAQEALQLTDAQYGQFVTRLKRLHETRRVNMQRRNRLLQQLRRMTAPGVVADEQALRDRLAELQAHDNSAAEQIRRAYASLDEMLNARQQARFRVFEEQMERRKLDLLLRARERAASRRGR